MSTRTILIGAFALVFGLSSALAARIYLKSAAQEAPAGTMPVLVAAMDLQPGHVITPESVKLINSLTDSVPEGALTSLEQAIECTVKVTVDKGQVLLGKNVASKAEGRGLAVLIPKGMRAYTIPTGSPALAGLLVAGNRVDVSLTTESKEEFTGGSVTTTFLQDVEVRAVGQIVGVPQEGKVDAKGSLPVTLLVTPEQVRELKLAQDKGILSLSLRNPLDKEVSPGGRATMSGLQDDRSFFSQAKKAMDYWMKLQQQNAPKQPKEVATVERQAPPARDQVNTLRGRQWGAQEIEWADKNEDDRRSARKKAIKNGTEAAQPSGSR